MDFIFRCLPANLSKIICEFCLEEIEEIRVRANKPVIIKTALKEIILDYYISSQQLLDVLQSICCNSIYAFQSQISKGFVTLPGGNRVGISGNVVVKDGNVLNISYIYSLNFRISHQIENAGDDALRYILDIENKTIFNTLIVSPPGVGKTTMIRAIAKKISNGIESINLKGVDVSVIDERGEIAALSKGEAFNDVGIRTDILDNVPKSEGIRMAVRSLAPKVIIADEIGNLEDVGVVNYAICSGVKCIFTAHGSSFDDLEKNNELNILLGSGVFEKIIFLDERNKGKVKKVVQL